MSDSSVTRPFRPFHFLAEESPDPRLPIEWLASVAIAACSMSCAPANTALTQWSIGNVGLSIDGKAVPLAVSKTSPAPEKAGAPNGTESRPARDRSRVPAACSQPSPLTSLLAVGIIRARAIALAGARALAATDPPVDDLFLRGRLAVEDRNCVACHRPAARCPFPISWR